jgi:transcriptional regulator with XRE-family HTH domain
MNNIFRKNFNTMPIHQQLRFLRKRKRKTQEIIGDLIGLSERTVRAYETAERLPDLATLSLLMEDLCEDDFEARAVFQSWEYAVAARDVCYRTQCKQS